MGRASPDTAPRPATFVLNVAAIASLGISAREIEVLRLIAAGQSNKVIARMLSISPNTVKPASRASSKSLTSTAVPKLLNGPALSTSCRDLERESANHPFG